MDRFTITHVVAVRSAVDEGTAKLTLPLRQELMGPPSNVFFSTSAYFVNGNA